MKVFLTALLVFASVAPVSSFDWPVERIKDSIRIVGVDDQPVQCTAFLIDARRARWITASHCVYPNMFVDTLRVQEIAFKDESDTGLAVIGTELMLNAPQPLKLGPAPKRGQDVLALGHVSGPFVLFPGVFMSPEIIIEDKPQATYALTAMQGMSGGPVIDRSGRVVGVITGGIKPTPLFIYVPYGPQYAKLKQLFDKYAK